MKTRRLVLCAVLTALALALSVLERALPLSLLVPLPGIKLGLANVVTLFALYALNPVCAAAILLLRCVLGSIFGGSVTSLLFSLAGGALSFGVMALFRRFCALSVFGVSVLGAAAHSIGQVLCAAAVLGSPYVLGYLPPLLLVSIVCGLAIGALTGGVLRVLQPRLAALGSAERRSTV